MASVPRLMPDRWPQSHPGPRPAPESPSWNGAGSEEHRPRPLTGSDGRAIALSALLTGAGLAHLLVPGVYEDIVPHVLPGPPLGWTVVSGIAELACGALVARRSTRRAGAILTAILFVAIFPANIQMAVDWRHRSGLAPFIAYGRLPLQVLLVAWALSVRRPASASPLRPAWRQPE